MKTMMMCEAVKRDGTKCTAPRNNGSPFCFFHNPERAGERLGAQKKGGQKGLTRVVSTAQDCPEIDLKTPDDVRRLISDTINKVRLGKMEIKVCTTVGYLAQIGLRAIEQSDLEERMRRIEAQLEMKQG